MIMTSRQADDNWPAASRAHEPVPSHSAMAGVNKGGIDIEVPAQVSIFHE